MPRLRGRGGNIGRRTRNSQLFHTRRLKRTAEDVLTDNANLRDRVANTRANESQEQRDARLQANALRQRQARRRQTDAHKEHERQRLQVHRALTRASLLRLAYKYEVDIDYSSDSEIVIGAMDKECQCESADCCCASEKVVLQPLNSSPEPLKTLLADATPQSKLLMTLLGATKIVQNEEDGRNFKQ